MSRALAGAEGARRKEPKLQAASAHWPGQQAGDPGAAQILGHTRAVRDGRLTLRDGRTLAWREYGPGDGHPVVWFHGTPGSRNSRHADETVYDRLQVRLIVFDRPGYGASSRLPGRGIAVVADDAAQLLDELALASVHVGGGSGGGAHILALAAGHPERVLAATVVAGGSPFEDEADLDGLIELNRDAWHAAQEGWGALYAFSTPVREQMLADPLAGFRAIMDSAPARDQAVIDDPAWQRVFTESMRPFVPEPKGGSTSRWLSFHPGTSIRPQCAAASPGGTGSTTPTPRSQPFVDYCKEWMASIFAFGKMPVTSSFITATRRSLRNCSPAEAAGPLGCCCRPVRTGPTTSSRRACTRHRCAR